MDEKYDPKSIESKWQQFWETSELFKVEDKPDKEKHLPLSFLRMYIGINLFILKRSSFIRIIFMTLLIWSVFTNFWNVK